MKARKSTRVSNAELKEQIAALRQSQLGLHERLEAIDARLARMELDLASIRARLRGPARIEPEYVAEHLGLTRSQSLVAVALAEGNTVRKIAETSGVAESTVRFHIKEIYRELRISTQTELVRLVLLLPYGKDAGRRRS